MRSRSTPRRPYGRWALALALFFWCLLAAAQDAPDPELEPSAAQREVPAEAEASAPEGDPEALEGGLEGVAPEPDQEIEEIVVKGGRRTDELQDVPVAATVFGADEIDSLRIQDISDLADYTPNLEINTAFAASNPTLFIRGIGLKDYNANAAGAVAVYQDGININAPAIQLFQLFDVKGVEVLRGPQGSLNGRNATAGAIMVNSALPDGEWGVQASVTYGNYNAIEVSGAVDIPILEELLSARLAFTRNLRDGITDNVCADWNPQAHAAFADVPTARGIESFLVTPETLLAEFQKDLDTVEAGSTLLLKNEVYRVSETQNLNLRHRAIEEAGTGATPKALNPDNVCIVDSPGRVITPLGEAAGRGPTGTFLPDNVTTLADLQGLKHRTNNVDNWASRGILRFRPRDMDWILNLHGGRNRGDSRHLQMLGATALPEGGFRDFLENNFSEASAARITNFAFEGVRKVKGIDGDGIPDNGEGGDDPFVGYYNQDGTEFLDTYGVTLRGFWDLGSIGDVGSVVLTSLSGYEWYDRFVEDEGDANPSSIFPADWSDSSWQVSQELRAEREGDRYGWGAGLFFLYENLGSFNVFPDTRQFEIQQSFDQTLWSLAPYLHGRYEFTEALRLEAGIRYNAEAKDFTLSTLTRGTTSDISVTEIEEDQVEETWTGVTGDVTLSYAPAWAALETARIDSLRLYFKYGRGFKGGHFNAGLTIKGGQIDQRIDPVKPEFIHSAEVGWKSTWFDNRLLLNLAGFRYWYDDLQVFDIENSEGELPLQKLLNGDARVWGMEAELEARPLPGLFLRAGFGWLDTKFEDFQVQKTVLGRSGRPGPAVFDYSGNPLIAAPRYNLSGIVEYTLPLFRWGSLVPQYDFSYRSKQYLDPQMLDPISQEPYWVHNARLAYRTPDERLEVAGWVRNLTNEFYKVDVFDLTREFDTILEVWGDPRTYGVTVSYTW